MKSPSSSLGQRKFVPTFSPKFIHSSHGVDLVWLQAGQRAQQSDIKTRTCGLPGSAQKVFTFLKARTSKGDVWHSRHGIARRSYIPRSTVRDGVGLLIQAGWAEEVQGPTGQPAIRLILQPTPKTIPETSIQTAVSDPVGGANLAPREEKRNEEIKSSTPKPRETPGPRRPSGRVDSRAEKTTAQERARAKAYRTAGLEGQWVFKAAKKSKLSPEKILQVASQARLVLAHANGTILSPEKFFFWAVTKGSRTVASRARRLEKKSLQNLASLPGLAREFNPGDIPVLARRLELLLKQMPGIESPGYLEHTDAIETVRRNLAQLVEAGLDDGFLTQLRGRLEATIHPDVPIDLRVRVFQGKFREALLAMVPEILGSAGLEKAS